MQWWDYANGKLKKLAVSLAVDFKASRTGDGISALPNPTGGGRGGKGEQHFINAPASLIRDRERERKERSVRKEKKKEGIRW